MKTRTVYVVAVNRKVAEELALSGQWFSFDGPRLHEARAEASIRLGRIAMVYPVKLTATAGKVIAKKENRQ